MDSNRSFLNSSNTRFDNQGKKKCLGFSFLNLYYNLFIIHSKCTKNQNSYNYSDEIYLMFNFFFLNM